MSHSAAVAGKTLGAAARASTAVRFPLLVRVTHWLNAISFAGLVVSGIGILLAHPRFYWGETGGIGMPSLFDLPLPFMLGGPSGWGRYMHFQSAWLCVLTGSLYLSSGVVSGHFRDELVPARGQLTWSNFAKAVREHLRFRTPAPDEASSYNLLQRLSYLAVVFGVFPLMLWTGMAMSPAVTSVCPFFVTLSGGFQSARTIHFFAADALVLFVLIHVVMVGRAGFVARTRAMITGRTG